MAYTRDIIVLANSVKKGAYCVAGKDLATGAWVRPVASAEGDGLDASRIRVTNVYGTFRTKPLQIVSMTFMRPVPLTTQPENHLVGEAAWRQRYRIDRGSLSKICDTPDHIWQFGDRSDRFEADLLTREGKPHQSLYLIYAERIHFMVTANYYGNKKIVGSFRYHGDLYRLSVTDPRYHPYTKYDIGHEWEETGKFLCLSQTDVFHGFCYKLIAAIL